jgi:hypothetical protein
MNENMRNRMHSPNIKITIYSLYAKDSSRNDTPVPYFQGREMNEQFSCGCLSKRNVLHVPFSYDAPYCSSGVGRTAFPSCRGHVSCLGSWEIRVVLMASRTQFMWCKSYNGRNILALKLPNYLWNFIYMNFHYL